MKSTIIFLVAICSLFSRAIGVDFQKEYEVTFTERYVYSNSGLIYHNQFLYALTYEGLSIYNVENEKLIRIHQVKLNGIPSSLTRNENTLFVAMQGGYNKLFKIDLSIPGMAQIVDSSYIKGSYVFFIDQNRIFINKLLDDNTWELLEFDHNLIQNNQYDVPYRLWPVHQLCPSLYYIHKANAISILKINGDTLVEVCSISDTLSYPAELKMVNDSTLISCSSTSKTKIYSVTSTGFTIKAELPSSENYVFHQDDLFLKNRNQINIYDISNISEPVLISQLKNENYINSFTLCDDYVWITTYSNKLRTFKLDSLKNITLINSTANSKVIASTLMDSILFLETIDNKLMICDVNKPNTSSCSQITTNGQCIALTRIGYLIQRSFFDYKTENIYSDFYHYDHIKHNLKYISNTIFRGNLTRLCTDTLISFYEQYLYFYFIDRENIFLIDSIKLNNVKYGVIAVDDGKIILAAPLELIFFRVTSKNKIELVDKIRTFIRYPVCDNYNGYIVLSDQYCKGDLSVYTYDVGLEVIGTYESTGKIAYDKRNNLIFSGCRNIIDVSSIKQIESMGVTKVSKCWLTNYSDIIALLLPDSLDNRIIVAVKDTGYQVFKY